VSGRLAARAARRSTVANEVVVGAKERARSLAAGALLVAVAAGAACAGEPEPKTTWAVRFADGIIARWPDPVSISTKGFEYEPGIVMHGMSRVYQRTRERRFLDYVRRWVDHFVDDAGNIAWRENHNLDFIQPAVLILFLHDETGHPKYAAAARRVRERFSAFPTNAEGGFWHKDVYPNEMWVDGIYMAEPFIAGYGRRFGDASFCYDTAVFQTTLVASHALNRERGLLYHAWDQDRNAAWADPKTGLSPEFWSRGMGWYVMALVDILAELPKEHPGYERLLALLREVAAGLEKVQDPKSGLWYQVLDKGQLPDNWHETSGSGMFVYALKVGSNRGLIDRRYGDVAAKAWAGLKTQIRVDEKGLPVIGGAVQGMGAQKDYAGYVGKTRLENSPHGLCAIQIAASQMETY
jgi:unsaturated rhamnogalacturonyl hydrolase